MRDYEQSFQEKIGITIIIIIITIIVIVNIIKINDGRCFLSVFGLLKSINRPKPIRPRCLHLRFFYKFSNYQFMAAFSVMNRSRTNHSDAIISPAPLPLPTALLKSVPFSRMGTVVDG